MGMDQHAYALKPTADNEKHVLENPFFYWRKDYQLHQFITGLGHPQDEAEAGYALRLNHSQLDALEKAVSTGIITDGGGQLSDYDGKPASFADFLRLARQQITNGKVIYYAAGW